MKWKFYIGFWLCLICGNTVSSQHFIGEPKSRVKQLMGEQRKELIIDEFSVNTVFNTLKYIDRLRSQTLLFVFSEEDICLYTKWMCDYSMMNKVISDLSANYKKSSANTWYYDYQKQRYIITLSTGEWFFTITTRKEEKLKDR